jgi:nucleotide-binding universal stress UspA family protein
MDMESESSGDRPVVSVYPDAADRRGKASIICGVDSNAADAFAVTRVAADLAARLKLPLTLVHVVHILDKLESNVDNALDAGLTSEGWRALFLMRRILEEVGDAIDAQTVIRRGRPPDELVAVAHERDAALIVVGCHARGNLRTLLEGSVWLKLSRKTPRPVVIVPLRTDCDD